MVIDGKQIAYSLKSEIKEKVPKLHRELSLGILVVQETPAIKQFVALKESFGRSVGVKVVTIRLGTFEQENEKVLEALLHATKEHNGVILQLPLPPHILLENVLKLYPFTHDVDVLGYAAYQQFKEDRLPFLPPVVGAFEEVLRRNEIKLAGKKVVVVGDGRLVGAPASVWARRITSDVTVVTKEEGDLASKTKGADVLILGAGVPSLVRPDMVKEGVVILDAGSGEDAGVIKGDADPLCAEKATLFTPTPGGIGPITVAKVFQNLLILNDIRHPEKM